MVVHDSKWHVGLCVLLLSSAMAGAPGAPQSLVYAFNV